MFVLYNELHPEYNADKNILSTAIVKIDIASSCFDLWIIQTGVLEWDSARSPSNTAVSCNIYKYVQGRLQLQLLYGTEENQLESNLSRDESFLTLTNHCSVRLVTSYHLMKYQNLMTSFVKKQTLSLIQCF